MDTNAIAPNNNSATLNTKNIASQTLFRFVSLRNPQLTQTDSTNLGFVYRPANAKNTNLFDKDNIINAKEGKIALLEARLSELLNDASLLPSPNYFFKSEEEVKQFAETFFNLGEKIVKNELENLEVDFPLSSTFSEQQVWDNLIYQVLTQEDFYVKEAIIQVIKGKHYSDNYSTENKETLKNAKVVLPTELFLDDQNSSSASKIFTVNESNISDAYIQNDPNALTTAQKERMKVEAQKLSDLNLAKLKKSALENLRSELQNLQKSYQKSYNKAYKTAFEAYQQTVAPLMQAREAELAAIEAQITDTTTEAQKQQLYSTLSNTEIPAFNFDYKNEINFGDLQANLSENSLNSFAHLFTETENPEAVQSSTSRLADAEINSDTEMILEDNVITLNEDYQTYQNIYDKLTQEIDGLSQTILSSSYIPQKQFAKIGPALVPISIGKSATHLAYAMMANYTKSWFTLGFGNLQFSFDVEDASWGLDLAKITAETDKGHLEETYTDIAVVDGKVTLPASLINKFRIISLLKIELFFTNSREAVLEFSDVVNNFPYFGTILLKPISSTVSGNSTSAFMPKHFGVKRLGIADYLKVEQSLHAYVPGEVSNIENVMASELRHKGSTKFTSTETTDTTNKTIETEHISDTATATRNEMQSEVANVMEQDRNFEAHASYGKGNEDKGWHFEIGASYASHNSQQTSTRQAVTKAQEITNRAMDRIVSKVTEERVVKIINQFTENNTHEFDNRGNGTIPPQHIAGVYRWVDKKYKNQIYNYGKRAMFEFMIPEPAKLHRLATAGEILTEPIDPRKASENKMTSSDVDDTVLQHWAEVYGITLDEKITKNVNASQPHIHEVPSTKNDTQKFSRAMDIPENYVGISARVDYGFARKVIIYSSMHFSNFKGSEEFIQNWSSSKDGTVIETDLQIKNGDLFVFYGYNINSFDININITCEYSAEYLANWRKAQFTKIIDAYTQAKTDFDKKKAELAAQQKDQTENFYRDMEEVVLKHNCIAYLLQDYGALGTKLIEGTEMKNFKVLFGDDLDKYTALAKFMEQAFEWNIMSYTFYPYYWANKEMWKDMYTTESIDPLFRNFLQAGMARVIVTVKPGFEDAVQFFMNTGRIWNGGEVPVIGDPLYLSIVDELREPTGKPQGKAWITRIPTTLNILQAKSIGLEVETALPISTENPSDFEEPKDVETTSPFGVPKDVVLVGSDKGSTLPKEVTNVIVRK